MKNLAIVIPYYKIDFFDATLASIAHQTCKDFTVYIGDDCSPNDPKDIVAKYTSVISVKYKRFEENLGGKSLVAQWERCIAMSEKEEWIWLFSDDDIMDEKCVETFYNGVKGDLRCLYHFNTNTINSDGKVIGNSLSFPEVLKSNTLFKKVRTGRLHSYVVEYIFSRETYNEKCGFEDFPLAWGSDLATWCKFSEGNSIITIDGPRVKWRRSDKNITPDGSLAYQKCLADIACLEWFKKYFKNEGILNFIPQAFMIHLFHYAKALNENQIRELLYSAAQKKIISYLQCYFFRIPGLLHLIRKMKAQKNY